MLLLINDEQIGLTAGPNGEVYAWYQCTVWYLLCGYGWMLFVDNVMNFNVVIYLLRF